MPSKAAFASCVIMDQAGGVLMLHRVTPRQQWELPGGAFKPPDEPAEVAAARHVKSLLGLDARVTATLGARSYKNGDRLVDYTWFTAIAGSGEPRLADTTTYDKWGYFSLVTLSTRFDELSPGTKQLLEAMAYGEIVLEV